MDFPKWGTYDEKFREVESKLYNKDIQKRVQKEIETILKGTSMTKE